MVLQSISFLYSQWLDKYPYRRLNKPMVGKKIVRRGTQSFYRPEIAVGFVSFSDFLQSNILGHPNTVES